MTAIVLDKFRFANLRQAKKRIDDAEDYYYLAIGRSESWSNESLPPTPDVDYEDEISARHAVQGIKRVTDITFAAPRYNWTSGNTYVAYDDTDADLHTKAYYVLNQSSFNVYLCVKAGSGTSTVEPTGVDDGDSGVEADRGSVTPTAGADGYVWKYMYTISASDAQKYLTNDFIPVFRDTNVAGNAIQGAIHDIRITGGGTGYDSAPTITISGDGSSAAATATLTAGVVTGITITNVGSGYTYATIAVSGGTPDTAADLRAVVAPLSTGREINAIGVTSGGTSYTNGAMTINITGDGYSATATGTVSGGVLQDSISVTTAGYNYTEATAAPATTTAGDAAVLAVSFTSGKGGFGYDPAVEMNAYYIMFNVTLEGDENATEGFNGDFITANNYRQLMLLKNPLDLSSPQVAFTDTTGMGLKYHTVQSGGTWALDDTITGGSSAAQAVIDFYDSANERVYYHQNATTGFEDFSDGETLTGAATSTGTIAVAGSSANVDPEFDRYSGNVLYLENRVAVSRAADQTEDIKLVVQF